MHGEWIIEECMGCTTGSLRRTDGAPAVPQILDALGTIGCAPRPSALNYDGRRGLGPSGIALATALVDNNPDLAYKLARECPYPADLAVWVARSFVALLAHDHHRHGCASPQERLTRFGLSMARDSA